MSATVQIHVADASVSFPSNSAKFALFRNTSAVSIDVTKSAVTETVATGGYLYLTLTANTNEVSCVRTDSAATAVDVVLIYGFDEETINLLQYIRTIGVTGGKLGFLGATPIVQRVGAAGAAVGAPTYAAPEAGELNTGDAGSDTVIASLRTQLIALAADVATHRTLANELRATLVAFGLHKGAA